MTANDPTYPLLSFPGPIRGGKPPTEWSRSDAREVLDWLVRMLDPRTDAFLERVGASWADDRDLVLARVEAQAMSLVRSPGFAEHAPGPTTIVLRGRAIEYDEGLLLTAYGEALGVDIGLTLARYLQTELADAVSWVTEKHGRTNVSYNLPVLVGPEAAFDPMLIGPTVARTLLNDERPGWKSLPALYTTWAVMMGRPQEGSSAPRA